MSIVTDELKSDAEFLRELAGSINARMEGEEGAKPETEDVDQLNRIAGDLGNYASLMHSTSLLLEQRVEEAMDVYVRNILDCNTGPDPEDVQILTLWLIVRALRNGSSKALLGQGLASLGAGALGSMFSDVMKGKGKAPIDPDDNG